jgi:hypothetical protein
VWTPGGTPVATILDSDPLLQLLVRTWPTLSDYAIRGIRSIVEADTRPMLTCKTPMVEVGKTDLVHLWSVMRRLGRSERTVRHYQHKGYLGEAVRLNGSTFFHEADVQRCERDMAAKVKREGKRSDDR